MLIKFTKSNCQIKIFFQRSFPFSQIQLFPTYKTAKKKKILRVPKIVINYNLKF